MDPIGTNEEIDQPSYEPYENFRYMVFVSYTHEDNRTERAGNLAKKFIRWADWVQENLETYEIPGDLKGTINDRGEAIPAKLGPVFRDETDLPATGDLPEKVREALSSSRFLIVICSPRSARTYWINEEIRYFKRLGRRRSVLPLIVDGEPGASISKNADMIKERECFPPALLHPLVPSGPIDFDHQEPLPLGADVRTKSPNGTHEVTHHELKAAANLLERGKLKLIAGVLGIDLGRLIQRDRDRQIADARRRARIARRLSLGFGVLSLIAIVLGVVAFWQRNIAREESQRAIRQLVRTHLIQADQLFNQADSERAIAHVAAAARLDPNNLYAASRLCRFLSERVIPEISLNVTSPVKSAKYSPDGTKLLTVSGNGAELWNIADKSSLFQPLSDSDFSAGIEAAQFSPDGKTILTAAHWHTTLWDAETGKAISEPLDERYDTEDLASIIFLSPDGKMRLLFPQPHAYAGDSWLVVLDANSGRGIAKFHVVGNPITARFSPDSKRIVVSSGTGSSGNAIQIWDLKTDKPAVKPITLEAPAFFVQFTANSQRVVVASNGAHPSVTIVDLATEAKSEEPLSFAHEIDDVTVDSRGVYILTAENVPGGHGRLQVWYASTLNPASEAIDLPARVTRLRFNSDGSRFLTVTEDRKVQLWDSSSASSLGKPFFHSKTVNDASFSPDGRSIVTACDDGTVSVWDATSAVPEDAPQLLAQAAKDVQFAADYSKLAGVSEKELRVWDQTSGKMLWSTGAVGGEISGFCFSPNGDNIVTASADGGLRIWDSKSGKSNGRAISCGARVALLAMTTDSRYVVVATVGGMLQAWDVFAAQRTLGPVQERGEVTAIKISPKNGTFLTVCRRKEDGIADSVACIWSTSTWKPIGAKMPGEWIGSDNPFSTDGRRVLMVSRSLRVRDTKDGRLLAESERPADLPSHALFSPDGTRIASESRGMLYVWDASTGKLLGSTNRGATIWSITFSPDGTKVLTASADGTARLWNSGTGKPLAEPLQHQDIQSAAFDPDGVRVVTVSSVECRIWDLETGWSIYPPQAVEMGLTARIQFGQSASTILLTSSGGPAWMWKPMVPWGPVPIWFLEFVEAIARWRINDSAILESIGQTKAQDLKPAILTRLAHDAYTVNAKDCLGVGKVPFVEAHGESQ